MWWIVSEKFDIKEWQDLEDKGWNSLLLGNGASIAVSGKFSYGTLHEVAEKKGTFCGIEKIFEKLKTKDFERALLACWYAKVVNDSLGRSCEAVDDAYESIRSALIRTVKEVHPAHSDVSADLESISDFMSNFRVVFSLNYGLIVYWAMMYGNKLNKNSFKDCFVNDRFDSDVDGVRKRYAPERGAKDTLVFYPHGNLVIAESFFKGELKIKVRNKIYRDDLLAAIGAKWKDGGLKPLFVSEGNSSEKLSSIGRSDYLRVVYEKLIPSKVGEGLVVYGWGMHENDYHILEALKLGGVRRMAVSVFWSERYVEYCQHVKGSLKKAGIDPELYFFWSDSYGCWNNPKDYAGCVLSGRPTTSS